MDESTGSVTLRALFPNPDGDLLPGMFVRGRLPEGQRSNTILVPQKSITRDPTGQAFAMLIDSENMVKKVPVETERAVKSQWLISSGLSSGDRLIVDGLQRIQPGMPVTPVNTAQESAPATASNNTANAAQ